MSSVGTIGVNADNFNISGNTNINNLTVSGTTSFPANSISSSAISGGGGGLTLTNNTTNTLNYIPFTTQATGSITAANTDTGLSFNASTNVLSCGGLSTTGNITLPTTLITPITGQLGYIFFGINNFGSNTATDGTTASANGKAGSGWVEQSSILLPVGVWLLTANITYNNGGNFGLSISASSTTYNYQCSIINPTGPNPSQVNGSRVVSITTATTYYLLSYTSTTLTGTASQPNLGYPLFQATKIA